MNIKRPTYQLSESWGTPKKGAIYEQYKEILLKSGAIYNWVLKRVIYLSLLKKEWDYWACDISWKQISLLEDWLLSLCLRFYTSITW